MKALFNKDLNQKADQSAGEAPTGAKRPFGGPESERASKSQSFMKSKQPGGGLK